MSGAERCDTVMRIIDEALEDYERSLASSPRSIRPVPARRVPAAEIRQRTDARGRFVAPRR